jgi:hypothetical protein
MFLPGGGTMTHTKPQTFENHARIVPMYHLVAFPILALNVVWALVQLISRFSTATVVGLLVAVALVLLAFTVRVFALTVQDRVIRLEMRLRLARLLSPDRHGDIDRLTIDQLVSLRFASDEELPGLVQRVLDENIASRKQIKQMIRHWTPDSLRA